MLLVPWFVLLAWLLARCGPGTVGKVLAGQFLIFGIVYPCLAGLDSDRQSLYFDLSAVLYLVMAAWLLLRKVVRPLTGTEEPVPEGGVAA